MTSQRCECCSHAHVSAAFHRCRFRWAHWSAGETLRWSALASIRQRAAAPLVGHALREVAGELKAVQSNQSLSLQAGEMGRMVGDPGPTACNGDAGAPILRYEASLNETTGLGSDAAMYGADEASANLAYITDVKGSFGHGGAIGGGGGGGYDDGSGRDMGSMGGGWAVVGVHSRVASASCASRSDAAASDGRAWLTRVARCWLWRVMSLWDVVPHVNHLHASHISRPPSSCAELAPRWDGRAAASARLARHGPMGAPAEACAR